MAQFDDVAPAAGSLAARADLASVPVHDHEQLPEAWLEHDRLDAYRVSLEFQQLAARLCRGKGLGALRDQLDRASVSICLNIAEGAGRTSPAEK